MTSEGGKGTHPLGDVPCGARAGRRDVTRATTSGTGSRDRPGRSARLSGSKPLASLPLDRADVEPGIRSAKKILGGKRKNASLNSVVVFERKVNLFYS